MSLRTVLMLVAVAHLGFGAFALFAPEKVAPIVDLQIDTDAGPGEIRAVYGGSMCAMGVIVLLGARKKTSDVWLLAAGLGYAGLTVGRAVSLYVDGAHMWTVIFGAVEATLTVRFAYGARKLRAAQHA